MTMGLELQARLGHEPGDPQEGGDLASAGIHIGNSDGRRVWVQPGAAELCGDEDRAPSEAEHRAKKVADMTDAIGLTAEQAQKAEGIIKNAQSEIRTIRDKSEAEVDVVRMNTRGEMRTFLTPEQLPKFEQYIQRMDEQRKKQKEAQQVK